MYEEVARVSSKQSLRLAIGIDLDRLSSNFGAVRQRGTKSSGQALLTFSSLEADINVNQGDIITARNGATFVVTTGLVVSPVFANSFRAIASQNRADLDFVGITDGFAVEVLVESTIAGVQGNVSKFTLANAAITGVSNVTNVQPFGGGSPTEDDSSFRSRILGIFSGANTGTSLGYRNAVLVDPAVLDAIVIEPGDTLMVRDGTQTITDDDGNTIILSNGTGGKVDIYIFGTRLLETIDSFIFRDLSNTGDPTNSANDFVLGQISGDSGKTVTQKRIDNLSTGILPNQPANNVVQITGSISGANFIEKTTDTLGRVSGNFELLKDTGEFGGSPWGFDKIHFISDRISDFVEDSTKQTFNGQDALSFTDILEISNIEQNINVVNENSKVSRSNRTSVQLAHFPVTNVTRAFNVTTGERYVITNQNPDSDGTINENGRITITGSSLPSSTDTLQVDYTWIFKFDPDFDFDNVLTSRNVRTVQNSADWGFSNNVRRESATLVASGSSLLVTVTHPISAVASVNVFEAESSSVGLTDGRLSVIVTKSVTNVVSVVRDSDGAELFNTNVVNGSFNAFTIFLPTDTAAVINDTVSVVYNAVDVLDVDGYEGSFNNNIITIVPSTTAIAGTVVEVNYIANVSTVLPATLLPNLPAIRSANVFDTSVSTSVGNQPTSHIFSTPGVVVQNLRQAPSRLTMNVAGSISPGIITVTGTTIERALDVVYAVSTSGLKQNMSAAIRNYLGLPSNESIPSNVRLSRITSIQKVTTDSNDEVLSVDNTFDLKGYGLGNNTFVKDESTADSSLTAQEFRLPSTADNEDNVPAVGQKLRVTFHLTFTGDSENVSYSRSGTLHSNKIYAIIDTIAISSGFTSGASASATLAVTTLNQPAVSSRYKTTYDYLAPKQNERITIRYNSNKLIVDSTLNIENTRPITADVLVKEATSIEINVTMNIVVTTEFINNTITVQQNVQDAVTAAINADQLGTTIDASDLINEAYTVDGVDRARILFFNRDGETGSVLSITAQNNEFIVANNILI
ncbi:baseplate J/gp47 family protein, partial [bacterium]|nr:baseplate J/gp47 family protein [bacterium]